MSNALTSFLAKANVPALSGTDLADALSRGQEVNDAQSGGGSDIKFLSFSGKTGVYALGQDREEVSEDDVYLVEPMSFLAGRICWKASKPVGRVEWSFFSPEKAVEDADLEDHGPYNTKAGEGWHAMLGFGCLSLDGDATSIKYTTNAVSARNAISSLINEIISRSSKGEPAMPVVRFSKEQFEAQGVKNYKPKFIIDAWVEREAGDAFFAGIFDLDDLTSGKTPTKAQLKKIADA